MIIFSFFLCCLAINCIFSNSISVPSALHRDEIGMSVFMQDSLEVVLVFAGIELFFS